ncbi:phosphotransferase family protein [Salinirarus marinus]|uniref:phosphotransferase family protein n=1 Tax=Salinirarus marinus TaxID=3068310 RepID=UPI003C6C46D2
MSDTRRLELSAGNAVDYLKRRGFLSADATAEARPLGGGVSNHVLAVSWDGGCVVVKQPLPNLAVEDDWPADVERVHNEAAAARTYAAVIEATSLEYAHVPDVVFEDETENVVGVECVPGDAPTWKEELLDGRVDVAVADEVGRVLGAVHDAAAGDDDVRANFASKRPFDQLRIDPYHRTTARRHPDVADAIDAEIERVRSVERTLVHGDYSPKNVLVDRTGAAPEPWIIDFEVAHWGDPAFDTAFLLNHLFIKSAYNREKQAAYLDAAFEFWRAYVDRVDWDVEAATVAELGVLMLARVDGKSPVEYVDREATANALRRTAKRTLTEGIETLDGVATAIREEARAR